MAEGRAFGRKIRLTIYTPENTTEAYVFESNLMEGKRGFKISGTVNKYFSTQPADATIEIYNLSPVECANILALRSKKVGDQWVERILRVRVEAGYNKGYFGTIFDGQILKPTMVKPDPNNTILRLTCLNAISLISAGTILTQTFNDGINYYSVAKQIIKENGLGDQIELSEELKKYNVDGSFVAEGTARDAFTNLATNTTGTIVQFDNDTMALKTWNDIYNKPFEAIVLNSQTGLMGFPALGTDGVTFQSVLNPNINIFSVVKIDNSIISINQPEYLANREVGAWLSSDGLYGVIKVRHDFDTTNGNFCTTAVCLARDYYKYYGER